MSEVSKGVIERARKVRLVLMDADGVLTDGRILAFADGNEARAFHARDGLAVRIGQAGGLEFGVISGRRSKTVEARAKELDFVEIHQLVAAKGPCVSEIALRRGLRAEALCFVGDDIVDVPAFRRCGLAVAPSDADPEVFAHVHHVGVSRGGYGIVREVVDLILHAHGSWDAATAAYMKE
jgi:3-deoxy-D-manno-octulosonate 8-phosphate phosphatase (KDO 8-P phosphatase)